MGICEEISRGNGFFEAVIELGSDDCASEKLD